ncbi:MAG: bifunctional glutamate N-acetyltransferase/amino-acid acetyltransferase ArgJ [Alphaproteobacteria bacterium]
MADLSPLAPRAYPDMPRIGGARLGAMACGIRYKSRTDLCLFALPAGTTAAGVFTKSLTAGAPVLWCRKALKGGKARAIVVNSGNSNAFTGKLGEVAVRKTVAAVAANLGCKPNEVLVASTGVIGEPLPYQKIVDALPTLAGQLGENGWRQAAEAIMTTDTFPKLATRTAKIGDSVVTINGIAKGSGMIAPDMATMLAFVATDAKIPAPVLQSLLAAGTARSFNAITVDGDTSTSDTLILCATGAVAHKRVAKASDGHLRGFKAALDELLIDLAQQVVRDGEGATKFVAVSVTGAATAKAARRIGLAIANSPLVKTAIAGQDANWGRIVMAVGKSGEKANRDKLAIRIGGVKITEKGGRVPNYDEAPVAAHMKGQNIDIAVDVGVGKSSATVWTCDLTHGYIAINGDYRS